MDIVKACRRIAHAAQRLNAQIKLTLGEPPTPLEHHVFQEVGKAQLLRTFTTATSISPDIDTHQSTIVKRGKGNGDTVLKGCAENVLVNGWWAGRLPPCNSPGERPAQDHLGS